MCQRCVHAVTVTAGSRRRRLWDLPPSCHCPVVGVCFPLSVLRQWVNKALGGRAAGNDYEIHVGAVAECRQRNRLSEWLQRDLDARYALTIQAFKQAKDTPAVAQYWADALQQGDVAGAFWATLTHPRCDEALQEAVLRDMHMLQHQAGAAVRTDVNRYHALVQEHGVLTRELARIQERCTRWMAEKSAEIEQQNAQLAQQRTLVIDKDVRIEGLTQELEALKSSIKDFESVSRLRQQVDQLTQRQADLEVQNARLRQQLSDARRAARPRASAERAMSADGPVHEVPGECPIGLPLKEKTILCVGGRNGNVSNYRDVIEQAGGHFAHHDGGLEDHHGALDAVLAAADLVICQTGCISHNAYWRVKDFCKRTGKQCVYVENPSTSALARTLKHIAGKDAETPR